jgi:hypothetical protein
MQFADKLPLRKLSLLSEAYRRIQGEQIALFSS